MFFITEERVWIKEDILERKKIGEPKRFSPPQTN